MRRMAPWDDVRRLALALPGTTEETSRGHAFWKVRGKGFVWERPLSKTDLRNLGDDAPSGEILGVRVADLGVKEALLAEGNRALFTIPHFDGYSAVLVLLDRVDDAELAELVEEAWFCMAPPALAAERDVRSKRRL